MFEYGSRVGFWRIARLLEERSMAATVMGCALALERNPAVAGYIRTAPFDVCAHGWRWENHSLLDETTERERIAKTVERLERDRTSFVSGKRVSVRVRLGGRRYFPKKQKQ